VGGVKAVLKKGMIMSVMDECITADDIAWIDSIGGETVLLPQQPGMTLGKVHAYTICICALAFRAYVRANTA
jgi:hypothetical protein